MRTAVPTMVAVPGNVPWMASMASRILYVRPPRINKAAVDLVDAGLAYRYARLTGAAADLA